MGIDLECYAKVRLVEVNFNIRCFKWITSSQIDHAPSRGLHWSQASLILPEMGRAFYSINCLGMPYAAVRELSFVLPHDRRQRQSSRRPKLVLLLSGRCHVEAGDDFSHPMQDGDLLILPTPCYHYYRLEKGHPARQYAFSIYFDNRILSPHVLRRVRPGSQREILEVARNLLSSKRLIPHIATPAITALLRELRQEHDEALPGWMARVRSLTDTLLVEIWRRVSLHQPAQAPQIKSRRYVINQVKELLAKSQTSRLTLAQIAWHVGWSEEHLARVFRKETGVTVMTYLRAIRVDMARTRLLQSSDTISSIAAEQGFATVGSFCRAFKHLVGQTPSQFRMNHPGERS